MQEAVESSSHLCRRADDIDHPHGNRILWHTRKLRRPWLLRHRQPRFRSYRLEPDGAVRAGAREDDANRLLLLVSGERAQEVIDRQLRTRGASRLDQMAHAMEDGHTAAGGGR